MKGKSIAKETHQLEHEAPTKPVAHTHEPSYCAEPCELHVVASLYWHALPVQPPVHEQDPEPASVSEHVPCMLHGVAAPPGHAAHVEP